MVKGISRLPKAKRGFVMKKKITIGKKTPNKKVDPMDALIKQASSALTVEPTKASKEEKKSKTTNRSAVRKNQKVRKAGAKRKQRRKGVN